MQLTEEEKQMLKGEQGLAVQRAMEYQVKVGEFFDAKKFVPIQNAHMMGDMEVLGEAGFEFLNEMTELKAECAVNTTTNARCFDFHYVDQLNQDSEVAEKEKQLIASLQKMNVSTADTCINYQSLYQPNFGEHVAWGDTGTVIYANSVLGARSNFESGPAAFSAALTGRVPAYGFHLDEHRYGRILVKIAADLKDLADWGAIGKIVGEKHQNYFTVPVFDGFQDTPTDDELKHLGASLASYGSMGMFHIVGVTPEASTIKVAFQGKEPKETITITNEDIQKVYESYYIKNQTANLVVFSGPQLSLNELKHISDLLEGSRISTETTLIITTNQQFKKKAQELGYLQKIENAGGVILENVCFYILHGVSQMRIENNWQQLVTNSAKLANIVGAHKFNPILRKTKECINIAISGSVK